MKRRKPLPHHVRTMCHSRAEFKILDLDPPINAASHYSACHFRYNLALSKESICTLWGIIAQNSAHQCQPFQRNQGTNKHLRQIVLEEIQIKYSYIPYWNFVDILFRNRYTSFLARLDGFTRIDITTGKYILINFSSIDQAICEYHFSLKTN